jgi:hypothetical protein
MAALALGMMTSACANLDDVGVIRAASNTTNTVTDTSAPTGNGSYAITDSICSRGGEGIKDSQLTGVNALRTLGMEANGSLLLVEVTDGSSTGQYAKYTEGTQSDYYSGSNATTPQAAGCAEKPSGSTVYIRR